MNDQEQRMECLSDIGLSDVGRAVIGYCEQEGGLPHGLRNLFTVKRKPRSKSLRRREAQSLQRAERAFDALSALVPKRICNEEIGDALEDIHRMVAAKRPRWMISVKITSTFFWVLTHALWDYIIKVAGAVKAVTSKGDGKVEK
jgi:hypothetical protein